MSRFKDPSFIFELGFVIAIYIAFIIVYLLFSGVFSFVLTEYFAIAVLVSITVFLCYRVYIRTRTHTYSTGFARPQSRMKKLLLVLSLATMCIGLFRVHFSRTPETRTVFTEQLQTVAAGIAPYQAHLEAGDYTAIINWTELSGTTDDMYMFEVYNQEDSRVTGWVGFKVHVYGCSVLGPFKMPNSGIYRMVLSGCYGCSVEMAISRTVASDFTVYPFDFAVYVGIVQSIVGVIGVAHSLTVIKETKKEQSEHQV